VLELASGEGYGAAILARNAERVIAVELDGDAVAHSRGKYRLDNLEFVVGSMLDLDPYPDGSFDLVVCFEAIEHVREQRELIEEIARVTGPEGVVVLSTPDRDSYNAMLDEPNPFHVRELNQSELLALLRPHFQHVTLWGQSPVNGSRLTPLDAAGTGETEEMLVVRGDDEWSDQAAAVPTYLVAVASHVALPPGHRSYLLDTSGDALRDRDTRIRELKEENRVLYAENGRLRKTPLRQLARRLAGRIRARVKSS
jgi:SAM-dependent methyltransferase